MKNVLVIGNGGREHAIVEALNRSPSVNKIFIIEGNGGTVAYNVPILQTEHLKILQFINENKIDLTIIGPEAPLSNGIVDFLQNAEKKVFGPNLEASKLESSKIFMKDVLVKAGVPTAKYKVFESTQKEQAIKFLDEFKNSAIVIKADGLAAGKGVFIAQTKEEAEKEIIQFLEGKFGDASKKIVIEEFLDGFEASLFAITDGKTVVNFSSACDHKTIFNYNIGANTGGMGTFSPSFLSQTQEEKFVKTLIVPVVNELSKRGIVYKGVLFAGLMIKENEAKVLEFNVRFGDPETQSILARFEGDFYEICEKTAEQNLQNFKPKFSNKTAVCVVIASKGYPETSSKGDVISLPLETKDVKIFHAGTKLLENKLVTNGGRVLGVTALGKNKHEARKKVYDVVQNINFEGMQYRTDIAREITDFKLSIEEKKWNFIGIGFYEFFRRLLNISVVTHFNYKNQSLPEKLFEFSILLTNDLNIAVLNEAHRKKQGATNVLSFPLMEEYEKDKIMTGDIVIALEIMQKEALEQQKTFKEHLAHLFVHSVLHLFGYDHQNINEMEEMEKLEDEILSLVF